MAQPTRIGYQKWMPHNLEVIKKEATMFLGGVKKRELVAMLKEVAQATLDYIESQAAIPQYTGNLHDATGVGVYVDGALTQYLPTKIATRYQSSGFHHRNEYKIDGNLYLQSALQDATTDFADRIWIVIFSAVPYAFYIEDRDAYFSEIKDFVKGKITTGLVRLKPKYIL